ncbi:hypothetical protein JCM15640A_12420 [Hoylesella timonensis 4401737 = DSM 22865 = JCM 15640]|uniref:DUF4843 domain-containing protein n=1 Tax=Hoylesella timonensis TaxID=386414 RepID=UPI00041EF5E5|nr:DUF4843 domain-containing protein [Hoylesella timonensis]
MILFNDKIYSVLLLLLCSCTTDNYLRYDTTDASLRFDYSLVIKDSLIYSFGLHAGIEVDNIDIPVKLIGITSPKNRKFVVQVVPEKTTAIENNDYKIEPCELLADSISTIVRIQVRKNASLNLGDKSIVLRLCANDNFSTPPINEAEFKIVLTNELSEPEGWIFDEYSRVKHEFVILHTGVATNYTNWSTSEQIYWKGVLINALYKYNKEHPGKPLTDENGLIVTF